MAHTKRLNLVTTAERVASAWADGEPLVDTDRRSAGLPFTYIADGTTTGAIPIGRPDNIVYWPWPTHGRSLTLPATGIDSVSSDGSSLIDAQATAGLRPSFHIVRAPDVNSLGLITAGLAYLPNSNLVAGKTYWLDPSTANALIDTEPQYSVPVCHVLRTDGSGAYVRFLDWRAYDRSTAGAVASKVSAQNWRIVIFAVQSNNYAQPSYIDWRNSAGVDTKDQFTTAGTGTAFASSTFSGATPAGLAFNGLSGFSDEWASQQPAVFPEFIRWQGNSVLDVEEVAIFQRATSVAMQNFDIEYSTDGGTVWSTFRSVTGEIWSANELKTYTKQ